jgi:aminocarboxymuconate-semialdehyde decarboxylase
MPYDIENGNLAVGKTIEAIEGMDISDAGKQKIYEENARKLMNL